MAAEPSPHPGEPGERPARIHVLPPEIAARIAAGEVIERPASVVKELVENAIDAGATQVAVEVAGGGAERIRVRDNGRGIAPEQVADAFERHATSKIRDEHDLFAVRTLGFRGEALAAIAAAAAVDLTTRPEALDAATTARMRRGRLEHLGSASAAPGTTIEVRDLFADLPARRRFLRTPRAETRAITQVLVDYALAYPEIAFRLVADGRSVLAAPGSGDPRDAVAAVHGLEVAQALMPARASRGEDGIEGDGDGEGDAGAGEAFCQVSGLVGAPSLHRGSRTYLHFVANGRAIGSRSLTHAVEQAYHALLPGGRHPVALIRITVPPDQVDVNVHPTKAEVRFRHERLVYATVAAAVRDALADSPVPAAPLLASPSAPRSAAPPESWRAGRLAFLDDPEATADAPMPSALDPLAAGREPDRVGNPIEAPPAPAAGEGRADPGTGAALESGESGAGGGPGEGPSGAAIQEPNTFAALLPALRPLGQVDATYIIAEAPEGLYLVDQHAAHERVLYERIVARQAEGHPVSQPLLEAAVVPLSAAHAALIEGEAEILAGVGWQLDATDGAAVIVRAVPAALAGRDAVRALRDYLDRLEAEERLSGPNRALATLACRAAVMAGDRLDGEQQRALLRALEGCETPHTCPHGRPTMLHLSRAALERSFGRR